MATTIPATDLDSLLTYLQSLAGRELPEREWTRLPTFGGREPARTAGVWSWDRTRLLVGTCSTDLRLVPRPRERSIMLRLTEEEHATLKAGAERAGMALTGWLRHLGMREAGR
jgi:hypothetical protein